MDHSINTLTLSSPAKLNLFLHIVGQRDDGYHLLQTLFQFIDLHDTLHFTTTSDDRLLITPDIAGLPQADNLIFKAAELLRPMRQNKYHGVHIHLEKRLPMGGGIGGGSSNAATTLLALNQLWECQLSIENLATLGAQLGADVPIFILGKSAFAEGIGDELTEIEPPTPIYLLIKPNCHVSTKAIFTDKCLTRDSPTIKISHALKLDGRNDCLKTVRKHNPEVNEAYLWLKNHGDAKLTGTGACLFLALDDHETAERLKNTVPEKWQSWVCHGSNVSSTHSELDQWIEQHRH